MHHCGGEARWVAYEENTAWHLGQVVGEGEKTLRLCSGGKIPRRRVWLDNAPPPSAALDAQVRAAAAALPVEKLWQVAAGKSALTLQQLTAAAAGGGEPAQQLAVLQQVLAHPVYFQRRDNCIYPAPAHTVEKALAAQARRQATRAEEETYRQQLAAGNVPDGIAAQRRQLLFAPDKTAPLYRALKQHCGGDGIAFARFFLQHSLLRDAGAYFEDSFHHHWHTANRDEGIEDADSLLIAAPPLPHAAVRAFSIDDAGTTEIDDAFSLAPLADGAWQLGIHIAAPLRLSATAQAAARQRMVSVYFPHQRHLMLPAAAVAECSLSAQSARPALSLYLHINPVTQQWHEQVTVLEMVQLEASITPQQVDDAAVPPALMPALATMQQLTEVVAMHIPPHGGDAGMKIDADKRCITPRRRDGISRVVEVLMRCANTLWGRRLAETGGGLFRHNGALHRKPAADAPYAWLTSPLRRYVDFANQRLLLAHLAGTAPPREEWQTLRRTFNHQAVLAQHYQKTMETHWALTILLQQAPAVLHGSGIGRGRVRLHTFPLIGVLPAAHHPLAEEGSAVAVRVAEADLLTQRLLLAPAEAQ